MTSRRRSRNRSIVGNLTDMQKRLKNLEARQAPTQLARKVVSTQNIALRAVSPDVVADNAIVRRTLAPAAVVSTNLAVVGDPDGAAVATDNIQLGAVDTDQVADESITNGKLAGDIEDDKIVGISASKIGPDLLVDDQLEGISTEKLIGTVISDQIESVDAATITVGLLQSDQIESVDAATITVGFINSDQIESVDAATITVGLIQDDQIEGLSGEKIIGGVDGALIVDGSIEAIKIAGVDSTVLIGDIQSNQIAEDAITTFHLAANAVYNDNITSGAVQGREILTGQPSITFASINKDDLAFGAVTPLELDDLAVERRHLTDDVVIARMINAGAVRTEGIGELQVTSSKIAGGTNIVTDVNSGSGISVSNAAGTNGRIITVSASIGSGVTQSAQGSHVHGVGGYSAAGSTGVASHTHPISFNETSTSNGDHSGHTAPATRGAHTHVVGITGNTGAPSTIKLKKEVTDYSMVDVKNLLNLELKRYKYKNQARHLQEGREWMYGYIAEEVEELGIEEIVGYDENKEPNAVNYSLLSTLVLELVKVQQTEIDYLREEIQRLKEKI